MNIQIKTVCIIRSSFNAPSRHVELVSPSSLLRSDGSATAANDDSFAPSNWLQQSREMRQKRSKTAFLSVTKMRGLDTMEYLSTEVICILHIGTRVADLVLYSFQIATVFLFYAIGYQ